MLVKAGLTLLAGLAVLSSLDIVAPVMAFVVGLALGLGLGLQKVVLNFVSGAIDSPVKPREITLINDSSVGNPDLLEVTFGVSGEEHADNVMKLAIQAATAVSDVAREKPPECWLTRFDEASLHFRLRVRTRAPQPDPIEVRGKVLLALWEIFRRNGVQIGHEVASCDTWVRSTTRFH